MGTASSSAKVSGSIATQDAADPKLPSIFLCYHAGDADLAHRIISQCAEVGYRVEGQEAAVSGTKRLRTIGAARVFLPIVTLKFQKSKTCMKEYSMATESMVATIVVYREDSQKLRPAIISELQKHEDSVVCSIGNMNLSMEKLMSILSKYPLMSGENKRRISKQNRCPTPRSGEFARLVDSLEEAMDSETSDIDDSLRKLGTRTLEVGSAYAIVEAGGIEVLLALLQIKEDDVTIFATVGTLLANIFATDARASVRMANSRGIPVLMKLMKNFCDHPEIYYGVLLLQHLSFDDQVIVNGGIVSILNIMSAHPESSQIQTQCCRTLYAMACASRVSDDGKQELLAAKPACEALMDKYGKSCPAYGTVAQLWKALAPIH